MNRRNRDQVSNAVLSALILSLVVSFLLILFSGFEQIIGIFMVSFIFGLGGIIISRIIENYKW